MVNPAHKVMRQLLMGCGVSLTKLRTVATVRPLNYVALAHISDYPALVLADVNASIFYTLQPTVYLRCSALHLPDCFCSYLPCVNIIYLYLFQRCLTLSQTMSGTVLSKAEALDLT